ncbi:MAG: IMP dehydrogenase [Candidatus Bipolaricaulota bacterium]|nr:IMP dehydrogenase [Candidatus Bipolaricaulota bacterium]MCS7275227.1 IMP dehydrogenase [Candidatus Bipolaricaulota bacterium]
MAVKLALTFDDVLLVPKYSEILPHEADVSTRLTPTITLKIPILSAAMDTVTEANMAIAMAKEGGLGIIHRNLSPERQADEVRKVKRYEAGIIKDPLTLTKDEPVERALRLMAEHNISGVPIVDPKTGVLEGLITVRDLQLQEDLDEPIKKRMTPRHKLITAPPTVSFAEAKRLLQEHRIEKLPLVDEKFRLCGLITMKDIKKAERFPNALKDAQGRLVVGAAVGTALEMEREQLLVEAGVDLFVIDTAHGHSSRVLEKVRALKKQFKIDVIAGNVATAEGTQALIDAGADAVKVGIGGGSICTTRVVTGVGVPQLSAILDCAPVARKHKISLIADGGIRYSGDIAKAIAAGANAVMIGGLLAGTEEAPGEIFTLKGESYKTYRGMGSIGALKEAPRGDRRYFWDDSREPIAEGIEGRVRYKGRVADVLYQLVGGLKVAMGYCGAENLQKLQERAEFVQITRAALVESHPHDVQITKEAPNYRFSDEP